MVHRCSQAINTVNRSLGQLRKALHTHGSLLYGHIRSSRDCRDRFSELLKVLSWYVHLRTEGCNVRDGIKLLRNSSSEIDKVVLQLTRSVTHSERSTLDRAERLFVVPSQFNRCCGSTQGGSGHRCPGKGKVLQRIPRISELAILPLRFLLGSQCLSPVFVNGLKSGTFT